VGTALSAATETTTASGGRLLLVDDEENILRSLRRLFRRESFRTVATTDPYEALSCLRDGPVAVLVTDQRMPELDGDHLIARIKAHDARVVCIRLTGYPDTDAGAAKLPPGAVFRTVEKPWDDEAVIDAVHAALEHYARADASAPTPSPEPMNDEAPREDTTP